MCQVYRLVGGALLRSSFQSSRTIPAADEDTAQVFEVVVAMNTIQLSRRHIPGREVRELSSRFHTCLSTPRARVRGGGYQGCELRRNCI
jgi:hypothetical protein